MTHSVPFQNILIKDGVTSNRASFFQLQNKIQARLNKKWYREGSITRAFILHSN